jgi:hypothetical protein
VEDAGVGRSSGRTVFFSFPDEGFMYSFRPRNRSRFSPLVELCKGLAIYPRLLTLAVFNGLINPRRQREHVLWVKMCNLCRV